MAGGSKLAVYTAIGANSVVTVAKLSGFAITGSGAMLSEGIHSFADVCNQVLLAVGMKRSQAAPDEKHPLGYGNEAFVWSLISAVGIFFLGCGVSLTHGVQALMHGGHHDESGGMLNIGILIFALVVEGASLLVAVYGLKAEAKKHDQSLTDYLRTTDDPFGIAVLLEDSAAVFGVLLALTAVGLTHYTHEPYWDAIGSISIGLLLGFVAYFLIAKNRELLLGRSIRDQDKKALTALLQEDPAIEGVLKQQAMVTGTDSYTIRAELDFDGRYLARKHLKDQDITALHASLDKPEALQELLEEFGEAMVERLGDEIDRIESKIRKDLPKAKNIDLEVD
jgi:solute carrier family 30 (zinc transporter), member 9